MQINSEDWFGVGEVDKNGIKARGQEAATGFPEWIMTKVRELVVVMSNDSQNFRKFAISEAELVATRLLAHFEERWDQKISVLLSYRSGFILRK